MLLYSMCDCVTSMDVASIFIQSTHKYTKYTMPIHDTHAESELQKYYDIDEKHDPFTCTQKLRCVNKKKGKWHYLLIDLHDEF